ncbi:hypothetical protein BKA70DRAFT_1438135 [Coprinopsis sp. MPI-PUGE-AT-0042]|nr:hypothetical protein BKA70DRAFT_1438135 [Coprinopsis sp. MPI-PUGE-AT-0042]
MPCGCPGSDEEVIACLWDSIDKFAHLAVSAQVSANTLQSIRTSSNTARDLYKAVRKHFWKKEFSWRSAQWASAKVMYINDIVASDYVVSAHDMIQTFLMQLPETPTFPIFLLTIAGTATVVVVLQMMISLWSTTGLNALVLPCMTSVPVVHLSLTTDHRTILAFRNLCPCLVPWVLVLIFNIPILLQPQPTLLGPRTHPFNSHLVLRPPNLKPQVQGHTAENCYAPSGGLDRTKTSAYYTRDYVAVDGGGLNDKDREVIDAVSNMDDLNDGGGGGGNGLDDVGYLANSLSSFKLNIPSGTSFNGDYDFSVYYSPEPVRPDSKNPSLASHPPASVLPPLPSNIKVTTVYNSGAGQRLGPLGQAH